MTEKQYILGIVRYVGIYCHQKFITPLDFHFLMTWWESGIPLEVVRQSIKRVAARRCVRTLWNFEYEIQKNHKNFRQLQVGSQQPGEPEQPDPEAYAEESMEAYMNEMAAFREDELLERFKNDGELNLKTKIFMRSLAPSYQTPEIEKLYRLNYIINLLRLRRRANVFKN